MNMTVDQLLELVNGALVAGPDNWVQKTCLRRLAQLKRVCPGTLVEVAAGVTIQQVMLIIEPVCVGTARRSHHDLFMMLGPLGDLVVDIPTRVDPSPEFWENLEEPSADEAEPSDAGDADSPPADKPQKRKKKTGGK